MVGMATNGGITNCVSQQACGITMSERELDSAAG